MLIETLLNSLNNPTSRTFLFLLGFLGGYLYLTNLRKGEGEINLDNFTQVDIIFFSLVYFTGFLIISLFLTFLFLQPLFIDPLFGYLGRNLMIAVIIEILLVILLGFIFKAHKPVSRYLDRFEYKFLTRTRLEFILVICLSVAYSLFLILISNLGIVRGHSLTYVYGPLFHQFISKFIMVFVFFLLIFFIWDAMGIFTNEFFEFDSD